MITREMLTVQMAALCQQEKAAADQLQAVLGAKQVCQHWLDECDRQDAEKARQAATPVETAPPG